MTVKYYDNKSKSITLVTDVKKDDLETKTFQYPFFVKGVFTKKAIDLGAELEENEFVVPGDLFDRITSFIVELYNKQFTSDELTNGIDAGKIIETYISILMGVLQGDSKNE
ncbi:phage tail assembly chaperone G [Virgibacillus sp. FSP13]